MEQQEFEQLAIEQLDAVYRMAFHLTRNAESAEDLVQEVFIRALKPSAVAGFESRGGGMRAWLFAIAHNVFYSKIKREARGPQAVPEFFSEESSERRPGEALPAWDRTSLDWEQVDGRLKKAIEDLKPDAREILLMWGVDGLKYREIAEILEVPIGTVMSRLHRARKTIAEQLTEDSDVASDLGVSMGRVSEQTDE